MYMYVCVRVYIHICILRCDLVHIDGGHFDFTPWNDLVELARASHDSTILVVDDTPSIGDVARAIREFLCFHICVLCRCMKLELSILFHDFTILVVDDTPSIGDAFRAICEYLCHQYLCIHLSSMSLSSLSSVSLSVLSSVSLSSWSSLASISL